MPAAAVAVGGHDPAGLDRPGLLCQQGRLPWADSATARSAPEAAITSSVLRPMLPVEPRMATFLAVRTCVGLQRTAV